DLADESGAPGS
ncbi:hypothetical protein V3C99_011861, partial [Haemonchus contortus]